MAPNARELLRHKRDIPPHSLRAQPQHLREIGDDGRHDGVRQPQLAAQKAQGGANLRQVRRLAFDGAAPELLRAPAEGARDELVGGGGGEVRVLRDEQVGYEAPVVALRRREGLKRVEASARRARDGGRGGATDAAVATRGHGERAGGEEGEERRGHSTCRRTVGDGRGEGIDQSISVCR